MQSIKLLFIFIFIGWGSSHSFWDVFDFPSSNTIVSGHTAGSFSVTDGGAATYTIPISISPGTGGVEPKLSLAYNSQGGNGLMGLGWSLQGLSTISRSTKTLAQDGEIKGIDLTGNDTYSLDGERLIATQGIYGGHETEYRSEQNAFLRLKSYGNVNGSPEKWKAWTKSGLVMEFGFTENSKIEAQGCPEILFWVVNRVEDTKGNYYTVIYHEDNVKGEYYPIRIDYTGNQNTGLMPYNSVEFTYQNRSDNAPQYMSGVQLKTDMILEQITAKHTNLTFRTYHFNYQTGNYNSTSLLTSIQECTGNNTCFEPTSFNWMMESPLAFSPVNNGGNVLTDLTGENRLIYPGDWNADGMTDLLIHDAQTGWNKWFKNSKNFQLTDSTKTAVLSNAETKEGIFFPGDYNADGYTDMMWFHPTNRSNKWYINQSNQDFSALSFNTQDNLIPIGQIPEESELHFSDFNGDGLTDVLVYKKSNGYNRFFLSQLDDAGNLELSLVSENNILSANQIDNGTQLFLIDFNNDGLEDIVWWDKNSGSNHWFRNLSNTSFAEPILNPIPASALTNSSKIDFGDWNGDGGLDLMWYRETTGETKFFYNKGDGTFLQATHTLDANQLTGSNIELFITDFNGDRVSDILYYEKTSGTNRWFLNDGKCDFSRPLNTAQSNVPGYENPIIPAAIDGGTAVQLASFTEDGMTDLFWFDNNNGRNVWFQNSIHCNNLIDEVTDGQGARTMIHYLMMTNEEVYEKQHAASYPEMDLQARLPIVCFYEIDNGIGGTNKVQYKYKGGRLNLHGRGFRGFSEVEVTDEATGTITKRVYDQDYRYISSPILYSETRLMSGELLQTTSNQNDLKYFTYPNQPQVHYSFLQNSTTTTYELNSTEISTKTVNQQFDDYGNLVYSEIDYGDGHIDKTYNTYQNLVLQGTWTLGRLTRSQIQRKAPDYGWITKTVDFEYDVNSGLLIKEIIEPEATEEERIVKTYVHDAYGNVTESHVLAWNGTEVEDRGVYTIFDNKGRFTLSVYNDLGHTEMRQYDQVLGLVSAITDANQNTNTFQYDGFGRKTREDLADGNWATVSYNRCNGSCPEGAVTYVVEEKSHEATTTTFLDLHDREICTQTTGLNGENILMDKVYDARGLIIAQSDPYFSGDSPLWTSVEYDDLGREISQTLPGNRTFTMTYNGLTTVSTNPLGQSKTVIQNEAERNTSIVDNAGNAISYEYDSYGNLVKITDPLDNEVTATFDHFGRKIALTDPNIGLMQYQYNQFDELLQQEDATGNVIAMKYDILGRLIEREEEERTTYWTYDTAPNGLGLLASISTTDGYAQNFQYDALSRLVSETEIIDGNNYTISYAYGTDGRISHITYPSGFQVLHNYNQYGYLYELRNDENDELIWRAEQMSAKGLLTQEHLGNGLTSNFTFDEETDWLESVVSSNGITAVQNLSFSFNDIGHLTQRKNNRHNLTENFQYDNLNRLSTASIVGGTSLTTEYDILGNITYKSDVGTYFYGENGAGPHQLTRIVPNTANTCIPSAITDFEYTSFDKVNQIQRGLDKTVFSYGANRQRTIQKRYYGDDLISTKVHVGILYEKEISNDLTQEIHYIRKGDEVIAVYNKRSDNLNSMHYWHKDHLGSLDVITDENGVIVEELSFDAWGQRRNANDWTPLENAILVYARGYTGHEHLDIFNLINMNGRVYDPVIGRFISPDPFVQDAKELQNYNRYSYVLNNPLSYTDPSGYLFKSVGKLLKGIVKGVKKAFSFIKKNWKTIAAIAVGVFTGFALSAVLGVSGGLLGSMVSAAGYGFGSSFTGTLLSGGSIGDAFKSGLKAAAISGIVAAATFGIGSLAEAAADRMGAHLGTVAEYSIKTVGHGIVQGVHEELQGGKFEHGFLSGAFSGATGGLVSNISNPILEVAAAAIVGGTAAELGGGKFANGALSGAFTHLFNDIAHDQKQKAIDAALLAADVALFFVPGGAVIKGGIWAYRFYKSGALGKKLFLSEKFGITSLNFGNSAAGIQGRFNKAGRFLKFGWSNTAKNGGGMNMRLGIGRNSVKPKQSRYHIDIPGTFVPNNFANPSMELKRALKP